MTVQTIFGAIPVQTGEPPEGKLTAGFAYTLTSIEPSLANSWALNSMSGGLRMSQVVTLCVDNSAGEYALSIVHGALNEKLIVPAFASVIVPTFSTKASYPINMAAVGDILPSIPLSFRIVLCNYARRPGSFSSVVATSIVGTGQNSMVLASGVSDFTFTQVSFSVVPPGNWVLDSIDIAIEGVHMSAIGPATINWSLVVTNLVQAIFIISSEVIIQSLPAGWTAGRQIQRPFYVTYPNGLMIPSNGSLTLVNESAQHVGIPLSDILMRCNVSGTGSAY